MKLVHYNKSACRLWEFGTTSNLTERRNTDLGEEHDKVLVWCMFSWHLVSNLEMINTFSPKTNLLNRSCYDGCFKYHRNVTGWSGKIVWIFLKEAIKNIRQTLLLHLSITRLDSKSTAAKSFLTSASLVHAVVSPRVRVEFSWVSSEASSSAASVVQSICDDYWSPAHFVFSWFIPQFKPVFNFHQLIFYICSVHTTFLWFLSVTQNQLTENKMKICSYQNYEMISVFIFNFLIKLKFF